MQSVTLSITINRSFVDVYSYLAEPLNFNNWAAGLGHGLHNVDGKWQAETPQGTITVAFSAPNPFGVCDHSVMMADGFIVYMPMRAIKNGKETDVQITVFRQPSMDDTAFAHDQDLVRKDLQTLKEIVEKA